jgi:protein TonB
MEKDLRNMKLLDLDKPMTVASLYSILLHALVILGVTLNPLIPKIKYTQPRMAITVANKNQNQSEQADYLPKTHNNHVITTRSPEALISEINQQRQEISAQPHRRQISAAAHEKRDEDYLDYWRRVIETVGNQHYPTQAKSEKITGELRLLVAINKDGSVNNVSIRNSSGHKVLDEAALQTIQLAAPFRPLPEEITKDTDVLEIIRTWHYGSDSRLSATG